MDVTTPYDVSGRLVSELCNAHNLSSGGQISDPSISAFKLQYDVGHNEWEGQATCRYGYSRLSPLVRNPMKRQRALDPHPPGSPKWRSTIAKIQCAINRRQTATTSRDQEPILATTLPPRSS